MRVSQPGPEISDAEVKDRILALEANVECIKSYGLRNFQALVERVARLEAAAAKARGMEGA